MCFCYHPLLCFCEFGIRAVNSKNKKAHSSPQGSIPFRRRTTKVRIVIITKKKKSSNETMSKNN